MRLALPSTICPWSFSVQWLTTKPESLTHSHPSHLILIGSDIVHHELFQHLCHAPPVSGDPARSDGQVQCYSQGWKPWCHGKLMGSYHFFDIWLFDGQHGWYGEVMVKLRSGCSQQMVNYPDYLVVLIMVLRMDWLMLTLISHTLSGNCRNCNWNIHHS